MLDLRYLAPDFAVAPQIALEDLDEAARLGFRTVINNRPEDEVPESLRDAAFAAAAEAAGLRYLFLPYEPGLLTSALAEAFEAAVAVAPHPVLAWCRSGTRSSHLWALAQAGQRPVEEILSAAAQAGYDHSGLVPLLRAKAMAAASR
ncbi:TIGR01244 family protein [Rhodobacter sp. TJ_12]|uniref:TIGR01244 family sulfur transferase n=1 Tax=Rhodobacter sp. TJ_12 TaxID=2029399 RepID=UPI001CBE8139|nr:TIGR01244 family sulfur transferase [Rhodobacter sp. TJ_12]MBZ4022483.1 TIGR01244 family protein [Rhodobacter sp. TJ_12]